MDEEEFPTSWLEECLTPRIYVDFRQDSFRIPADAEGNCSPARATFGPYHSITIVKDKMEVTAPAADEEDPDLCEPFTLAKFDGDGWKIHDGMEEGSPVFHWFKFYTAPPRPTKKD